jgi:hypothetical protein
MSLSNDIENILNSNDDVFPDILEKILMENLTNAKEELKETHKLNKILYEAIDFTVKKLDEEEGSISKLLYKAFGIGKDKNPRREQLLGLGGQLKSQITSLERDRKKIGFYYDNVTSSYESLTRLSEGFGRKVHFLTNKEQQKRCNNYLKDLYIKIDETDACRRELDMKSIYLESCIYKYDELLKRIPRYKEIRGDKYLEYKPNKEEE